MLTLLAHEAEEPDIARITREGRAEHRAWVTTSFGPFLEARPAEHREALTDLLVVATDLQTWNLLRQDRGLDRETTITRMLRLARAVLDQAVPDQEVPHQEAHDG